MLPVGFVGLGDFVWLVVLGCVVEVGCFAVCLVCLLYVCLWGWFGFDYGCLVVWACLY